MSTASTTSSTSGLPALPWRDVARDALALFLLLASFLLPWDFATDVHDHWWLVLLVLLAAAGLLASPLAWFGALGRRWQPVWNRGIRAVAAGPLLLSFVVLLVLDVFSEQPEYPDPSLVAGEGGVGAGATFVLAAVVMLVQTREHEHDPHSRAQRSADSAWWRTAQTAAGLSLLLLLGTSLLHFRWDDLGLYSLIDASLVLGFIVTLGLFVGGLVLSSGAWANALLVVVGFSMALALTPAHEDAARFSTGDLLATESAHLAGYGVWMLVAVAFASLDAGTRRFLGPRREEAVVHKTAAYVLLSFAVTSAFTVVTFVFILVDDAGGLNVTWLVLALLRVLAAGLGAAALFVPERNRTIVLLVSVGAISVLFFVAQIVYAIQDVFVAEGWIQPFLVGGVLTGLVLGPWVGRQLRTGQDRPADASQVPPSAITTPAPEPTSAPAHEPWSAPGPVAPSPPAARAARDQPSEPAEAAGPVAQDWGALGTSPTPSPTPSSLPSETSAAELARIAADQPDQRAAVASHPNAYPELLDWLARLADPTVTEALRRRSER